MTRSALWFAVLLVLIAEPASAQWETAAQQRIEEHRMNTLRVVVLDADGAPVDGAAVDVEMTAQAFDFGTAITAGAMRGGPQEYSQYVYDLTGNDRTFNITTFGNALKWPSWQGYDDAVKDLRVEDIYAFFTRGIAFRGHNLLWPGEQWLPFNVRNETDAAVIRDMIKSHIEDIIGYVASNRVPMAAVVREWDVLNEPYHLPYLANTLQGQDGYPTGREIYTEVFEWAHAADPDARLYINEYNVLNGSSGERAGYKAVIEEILDAGGPLSGIGMQGHFNVTAPPMSQVKSVLDDFAQYGLPIAITEYDYTNTNGSVDHEAAAQYMHDFLTMIYSHPAVATFVMWGFWDGDHWRDYAPIFFQDWTMKPSGQAFIDLVFDEWWTVEAGLTGESGVFEVDGHLGTYDVSVSYEGEMLQLQNVKLEQGDTHEIVFSVTATDVERSEIPDGFRIRGVYPNPVRSRSTIELQLPEAVAVGATVHDASGRLVGSIDPEWSPAGTASLEFDASGLTAGVYFVRVHAGSSVQTEKLIVIR